MPLVTVKGSKEIQITGICSDSRRAQHGDLFIARRGENFDAAQFIPNAVASGVSAVVTDLYDPSYSTITQIIHPAPQEIEADLSKAFYQDPSKNICLVGITGTNGKTTTAYLTKFLLDSAKHSSGLISTIESIIGNSHYPTTHTTLDVVENHKLIHEMVAKDCSNAILEVTSHGLDQGRVSNLDFDVAVFTNLTPEHLDYHSSMQEYASAKKKLFQLLKNSSKKSKLAIVNADSKWSKYMVEGYDLEVCTFGIDKEADLQATDIQVTPDGTNFILNKNEEKIPMKIPLIGRFNVYNALAAISICLFRGMALSEIQLNLEQFAKVPGRLEKIPSKEGIHVYVDFAHTADALRHALQTITHFSASKIFTVFGCGGNRDKQKRAKMAQVAEKYSTKVWITNDNPRKESPSDIVQDLVKGFSLDHYVIQLDRRKAIEEAICQAQSGDIVLIAGKGHETTQIFAHSSEKFDDREEALKALEKRCTFC